MDWHPGRIQPRPQNLRGPLGLCLAFKPYSGSLLKGLSISGPGWWRLLASAICLQCDLGGL